jgi:hypothetical protein
MRGEIALVCLYFVIARSEATTASAEALRAKAEAIHSHYAAPWIASRSLSSGAHSRDPLARNDGVGGRHVPRDHPEWFLQRFRRRPNTTADETGAFDA